MKRVLLATVSTVVGLVALLSFKSHGTALTANGGLPAASLPRAAGSATAAAPTPTTATTPAAPPDPSSPRPSSSTAAPATRTVTGTAVQTPYGVVQVKVSLSGTRITDVSFVQLTAYDGRSQQINQAAAPILLQQTLAAQSAQIDGVSGASYTSAGYEQSLQSALDQAR